MQIRYRAGHHSSPTHFHVSHAIGNNSNFLFQGKNIYADGQHVGGGPLEDDALAHCCDMLFPSSSLSDPSIPRPVVQDLPVTRPPSLLLTFYLK